MEEIKVSGDMRFRESDHKYWNINHNKPYCSITTLIGKYFPKFEATEQKTLRTRKRLKMTHEQVLEYWEQLRINSDIRGNEIHMAMEGIFSEKEELIKNSFVDESEFNSYVSFGRDKYRETKDRFEFHPEEIISSEEHLLAGQVDLPIFYKDLILVVDFKTNNKTLKFSNIYDDTTYYPIENLGAGDLAKYGLQLALYSLLLEMKYPSKKVVKNVIWHFKDGKVNIINSDMAVYIPYAKKILKLRRDEIRMQSR